MNDSITFRAFHGSQEIKDKYLSRVRAHRNADEIVSGKYWENGKGCAVGCTLHSDNHGAYETELGIPRVLARLEDGIFEALFKYDPPTAKLWPERFLAASVIGADLSMVWPKLAHWMLVDEKEGVIRFAKRKESREAIVAVGALYLRWINGAKPSRGEWVKARSAAYDAAYAAAAAAAAYAAAYAADAYAYAADAAAAYAADAYADADARKGFYFRIADKLIELMEAAR